MERRYLVHSTDVKTIATLEEQDVPTSRASPTINAAAADTKVERALSNPTSLEDKEDWTRGNLAELVAGEQARMKRRLRNTQEPCRAKRRKVSKSIVEAAGLAVKSTNDTVVMSPGTVDAIELRIDVLSGQLSSTKAEVMSLTSKVYNLEEARDRASLEHAKLLQKLRAEAKMSEGCPSLKRNGASPRYHGVLQSTQRIVKAADEQNAGHADTLRQLRQLFEEGHEVKAVPSLNGPPQAGLRVADLESAIKAKQLEVQTLPGSAAENLTSRAKSSQ